MLFFLAVQRIQPQLITPINAVWHAFSRKKDTFLKNNVNKHFVINVILTELKKPGCNTFHSYDVDIDITKLSVQSPLKYLVIEISENKDLVVLFLYHADHNSKSLYFKGNKK